MELGGEKLQRAWEAVEQQGPGPGEGGQEAEMVKLGGKEDGTWDSSLKRQEPPNEFHI